MSRWASDESRAATRIGASGAFLAGGHHGAALPEMPEGIHVSIAVGDARELPDLPAGLRSRRSRVFHRGHVCELCPGNPPARSANLDRTRDRSRLVIVPARRAGFNPLRSTR